LSAVGGAVFGEHVQVNLHATVITITMHIVVQIFDVFPSSNYHERDGILSVSILTFLMYANLLTRTISQINREYWINNGASARYVQSTW